MAARGSASIWDGAVEECLTGSGSSSLRCLSMKRTLGPSVPTESERTAR